VGVEAGKLFLLFRVQGIVDLPDTEFDQPIQKERGVVRADLTGSLALAAEALLQRLDLPVDYRIERWAARVVMRGGVVSE
jgi:hypothetical protein